MPHGSLQYWPHRRASHRLPRQRNVPDLKEPILSNIIAYKVGMTHVSMIDDSDSPSKQMEVAEAVTVLEIPRMEVYGMRLYNTDPLTKYHKVALEVYHKATATKMKKMKIKNDESKLENVKQRMKEFVEVAVLIAAYPKDLSVGQHHVVKFESIIGGKTTEEKFESATKLLGKEVKITEIFKPGEYIDTTSISKGKGWQGPIKRFHISRLNHKATGKIRHVGTLGAFTPGKIYFTVPQAGQLGFNYRTEHNKRILKIGTKADVEAINKSGGFQNYGVVKNDYIVVAGSIAGPSKRLIRLRKSIRERNVKGIKEPKVTFIAK